MKQLLLALALLANLAAPAWARPERFAATLKIHTTFRPTVSAAAYARWLQEAAQKHRFVDVDGIRGYALAFDPSAGYGGNIGVFTVTIGTANGVADLTVSPAGPNAQGNLTLDIVTNPTFTGTLTLSAATAAALSSTGTITITENTTGANAVLVLNASNGVAPSGDLLDVQLGAANRLQILNGGGVTSQGSATFVAGGLTLGAAGTAGSISAPATSAALGIASSNAASGGAGASFTAGSLTGAANNAGGVVAITQPATANINGLSLIPTTSGPFGVALTGIASNDVLAYGVNGVCTQGAIGVSNNLVKYSNAVPALVWRVDCNGRVFQQGGGVYLTGTTAGIATFETGTATASGGVGALILNSTAAAGNNQIIVGQTANPTGAGIGDVTLAPGCGTAGNSDILAGLTTAPANGGCHVILGGHVGTSTSCSGATPITCAGYTGSVTAALNSAVVNFSPAYVNTPVCFVRDNTTLADTALITYTITNSSLTLGGTIAANDVIFWRCDAVGGG